MRGDQVYAIGIQHHRASSLLNDCFDYLKYPFGLAQPGANQDSIHIRQPT